MQRRPTERLAFAGVVLPIATVAAASVVTTALAIPWVVTFAVLVAMPVMGAAGVYLSELHTGRVQTPEWFPLGQQRQLRDQVPTRYHEEFAPETLDRTVDDENGTRGRVMAFAFVYLVTLPAYTLVLFFVFGG